jgi:hypothetical protein
VSATTWLFFAAKKLSRKATVSAEAWRVSGSAG